MEIGTCPSCQDNITLRTRPGIGQEITCPHCDALLEVIEVNPLEFYWIDEDFEDDDYDDYDYDDDDYDDDDYDDDDDY